MKYLTDPLSHRAFDFLPFLVGMDGASVIPDSVNTMKHAGMLHKAGDGIDACIAAAINDAETFNDGTVGDVLAHLRYQRDQLNILIANVSKLPETPPAGLAFGGHDTSEDNPERWDMDAHELHTTFSHSHDD